MGCVFVVYVRDLTGIMFMASVPLIDVTCYIMLIGCW